MFKALKDYKNCSVVRKMRVKCIVMRLSNWNLQQAFLNWKKVNEKSIEHDLKIKEANKYSEIKSAIKSNNELEDISVKIDTRIKTLKNLAHIQSTNLLSRVISTSYTQTISQAFDLWRFKTSKSLKLK